MSTCSSSEDSISLLINQSVFFIINFKAYIFVKQNIREYHHIPLFYYTCKLEQIKIAQILLSSIFLLTRLKCTCKITTRSKIFGKEYKSKHNFEYVFSNIFQIRKNKEGLKNRIYSLPTNHLTHYHRTYRFSGISLKNILYINFIWLTS